MRATRASRPRSTRIRDALADRGRCGRAVAAEPGRPHEPRPLGIAAEPHPAIRRERALARPPPRDRRARRARRAAASSSRRRASPSRSGCLMAAAPASPSHGETSTPAASRAHVELAGRRGATATARRRAAPPRATNTWRLNASQRRRRRTSAPAHAPDASTTTRAAIAPRSRDDAGRRLDRGHGRAGARVDPRGPRSAAAAASMSIMPSLGTCERAPRSPVRRDAGHRASTSPGVERLDRDAEPRGARAVLRRHARRRRTLSTPPRRRATPRRARPQQARAAHGERGRVVVLGELAAEPGAAPARERAELALALEHDDVATPRRASAHAVAQPANPPPTIATSACWQRGQRCLVARALR